MSEVKVNKITPRTNCGTTTLGDSGDTINIPAGVTISNNGTATGFGATGAVNWDVASIKTVDFTATSGVGYFVDTATTGAVEVTLPAAPAAGDVVGVADYANNFGTANCTLNRNSLNIGGQATNATLKTDGVAVTLVYVDVTKGWIVTDSGNQTDAPTTEYVAATGGCITTCGNYKTHVFTSPGTFTVSNAGNSQGSNKVSYLVVAGGGGSGFYYAAAGAGGYREGKAPFCSYTTSPLACTSGTNNGLTVSTSPGAYAIVVGGGGAGAGPSPGLGTNGCASTFSTITSAGGGGGMGNSSLPGTSAADGGSGGASGYYPANPAGSGNTPPTSPPQGNNGGQGSPGGGGGGGGGGAGAVGGNAPAGPGYSGCGGNGVAIGVDFFGPVSGCYGTPGPSTGRWFAGGGTSSWCGAPSGGKCGGAGGGGGGVGPLGTTGPNPQGSGGSYPGDINTGGGGGGGKGPNGVSNGGSGIVVIRYRYQ
jgi:hypothetical protein